jgi:hypothetical protein
MKIRAVFLIISCLAVGTLKASDYHPHPHNNHVATCDEGEGVHVCKLIARGPINLFKTTGARNAKNIFISLSDNLAGELRLFKNQANNSHSIRGEFLFDNFIRQKAFIQYRVIFKDSKGAVAQTRGEIHLKHGKRQRIGFSTIVLREQDLKNITSYEIRLVASNQELHRHKH